MLGDCPSSLEIGHDEPLDVSHEKVNHLLRVLGRLVADAFRSILESLAVVLESFDPAVHARDGLCRLTILLQRCFNFVIGDLTLKLLKSCGNSLDELGLSL